VFPVLDLTDDDDDVGGPTAEDGLAVSLESWKKEPRNKEVTKLER
jgi:hypothetical protein